MAFVCVDLDLIVVANDLGPGARLLSDNQLASLEVQSNAGNRVGQRNVLELRHCSVLTPKVGRLASSHGKHRLPASNVGRRGDAGAQRNHLARLDLAVQHLLVDAGAAGKIKPSKRLSRGGDDDVGVLRPADELDGVGMHALANLKAGRSGDGDRGARTGSGELRQVKDSQLLFHASGGNQVGVIRRVGNSSDNVVVLESVENFAGMSIPDLAASG